MAQDKKSFVLYSDNYGLIKQLPDDVAGRLLKHIFAYVNDENPVSDDLLLNVAFEPIKMALKRDLKKYEQIKEKRSLAGKKSAEQRQQNSTNPTHVESVQQTSTNPTVSDSDNVSDNVSVIDSDNVLSKDNIIIPEIENFGSVAIEDFNFSHAKILKFESPSWLESVSMQQKITIEEIQNKIDDFVLFLKTTETQHKYKKAFLEHFINWVTKKNNSEKNGKQQTNASSGTKTAYKFDAARIIETNVGKT